MKKLIVILIVTLLIELTIIAIQNSRHDGAPRNMVEKAAIAQMVEAI